MKNGSLAESFKNAFNGLRETFKRERNFKVHIFMAALALLASFFFKLDALSVAAVIFAISAVLTAELINTAIEAIIDLYCGDKLNPYAKTAKDAAAGAVLLSSVFAVIVGALVFGDKIIELFRGIR